MSHNDRRPSRRFGPRPRAEFGAPVRLRDHVGVKCASAAFTVGSVSKTVFEPSIWDTLSEWRSRALRIQINRSCELVGRDEAHYICRPKRTLLPNICGSRAGRAVDQDA